MKYLFGKKLENLNDVEFVASFKNKENLLKYWDKIKENTNEHNFASEPSHWAAFCYDTKNKIQFKPRVEQLYILITKESEL